MNRTERLYRIDHLLQERQVVPVDVFLGELEVSPATFKRDLEYLRDRLNAPIVWDRDLGGYRFDRQETGDRYELPGLWFNASEIHALLMMQELLKNLEPGLLTPHIAPLLSRLRILLEQDGIPIESVEKRIRLLRVSARTYEPKYFSPLATAVLQRRRVVIDHYNKVRNETVRREVSPQRLTYYRENWYLDGYCHLREDLRSFGLDAVRGVELKEEAAKDVPDDEIRVALDGGYGIFAGKAVEWAELMFSPARARWVAQEKWHEEQQSWFTDDGAYHLRVPYSAPTELIMDILRHLPEVRVVSPASLQEMVVEKLHAALRNL
ncbi:helix-turn-helix transcriptional regulator [Burkholderia sp. PR2]|uniref:helix-turn-helix transcriptional regulator n=1 Tax=Burkholderia sp. PR2 TaxID=3448078 RepID=UPI00402ABA63